MGKGFKVIGIKDNFIISNNGVKFEYSKRLETQNLYIVCIYSHSNIESLNIIYNLLHKILGHPGKTTTLLSVDYIGNTVATKKTDIDHCEDCALLNVRRKFTEVEFKTIHERSRNIVPIYIIV